MTTRPDEFAAWSGPRWAGEHPDGPPREHTPAVAYIRRVSDGAVQGDPIDAWFWPDHGEWADSEFWWSEGNASCDCNRKLFFQRAAGIEDDQDCPCGDSAYEVRIVSNDGVLLYSDWACDA